MGLFDSVYARCPNCGREIEHQSKADPDPYMNRYTPETAPRHILEDILWNPAWCRDCGVWHVIVDADRPLPSAPPPIKPEIRMIKRPANYHWVAGAHEYWTDWDTPYELTADQFTDTPDDSITPRPRSESETEVM